LDTKDIIILKVEKFLYQIHIHTHMATKTISITEEAYEDLLQRKIRMKVLVR